MLGGAQFRVNSPLQKLHLVVARSRFLHLVGVRRLEIIHLRHDRPGARHKEYVAFIGAADPAHVGHAEAFDS